MAAPRKRNLCLKKSAEKFFMSVLRSVWIKKKKNEATKNGFHWGAR